MIETSGFEVEAATSWKIKHGGITVAMMPPSAKLPVGPPQGFAQNAIRSGLSEYKSRR